MKTTLLALGTVALLLAACTPPSKYPTVTAPVAKIVPVETKIHDTTLVDNYAWLKDTSETKRPEIIEYLKAENAYTNTMLAHTKPLQEALYTEMVARIKEDDSSAPYYLDGYWYYNRTEKGKQYPIYCRKKEKLDAAEQVLIDVNKRAEGHGFYNATFPSISPGDKVMAFAEDTNGYRKYNIRFIDLATGTELPDLIADVSGLSWAGDDQHLFYVANEAKTKRSYEVRLHKLGTDATSDKVIYHEKDPVFEVSVSRTRDKKYILIGTGSFSTDHYSVAELAQAVKGNFTEFTPIEKGHEYAIEHADGQWVIRSNRNGATNFNVLTCPDGKTNVLNWKELIPHRADVTVEDAEAFKQWIVVSERKAGLTQLRIHKYADAIDKDTYIPFNDPSYVAGTSSNPMFDTPVIRYSYTSLTTPNSTYDFDVATAKSTLIKQQVVQGTFKAEDYASERIYAKAADGKEVPISLVYKKSLKQAAGNPLLLYAYGSYGYSTDPAFNRERLSMLERGFVFAIAHVRGGSDLGRAWYDDGKLKHKMNTFTDFIACADHLIAQKYTSPKELFAQGGSAGGLLMGGVLNMAPDRFKGVHAAVPFVDVINTMLDESIPLTTSEFEQWGNPKVKEDFAYMITYSPYDNVTKKAYPNILVTTSLNDSQVPYWEPAKWTAKLRATKTDANVLLLKCEMAGGHGGRSGRYDSLRDDAMEFAWMLDLVGISK